MAARALLPSLPPFSPSFPRRREPRRATSRNPQTRPDDTGDGGRRPPCARTRPSPSPVRPAKGDPCVIPLLTRGVPRGGQPLGWGRGGIPHKRFLYSWVNGGGIPPAPGHAPTLSRSPREGRHLRNPAPHAGRAEGRPAPRLGEWGIPTKGFFNLLGGGGMGRGRLPTRPATPMTFARCPNDGPQRIILIWSPERFPPPAASHKSRQTGPCPKASHFLFQIVPFPSRIVPSRPILSPRLRRKWDEWDALGRKNAETPPIGG